jgi:uncharacterized membrane protein
MVQIDMYAGFWWIFPRCIAASFLLTVGVSLTISYSRAKTKISGSKLASKFVLRGLMISGFGAIITFVTFLVLGMDEEFVLFGILHLIGVSIILCFFFVRFTIVNLVIGLALIAAGLLLGPIRFPFYWFVWLGLRPENYFPVDYLPMLPWAGFVFIGLFLGNTLYRDGTRRFGFPEMGRVLPIRFLSFLGRYSLSIYLVHIPIIFGILIVIGILSGSGV